MREMKMMELSVGGVVWRFYAMMAGTIVLGFLGQFFLAMIWAFSLSISCILGISIKSKQEVETIETKEEVATIEKVTSLKKKKSLQAVG